MEIVKNAYNNQGAFGVKVYPPSGYKPIGNTIPGKPFALVPQPHRQWCARYAPHGIKITGEQLDARLHALYRWCSDNQVPIFTHCGQGEVQARKGYGKLANPDGWRTVLQQYPKLRLCLGHAGGDSEWYRTNPLAGWGRTVFDLCREYENVYCEFGAQAEIADPVKRRAFSFQIATLIAGSRETGTYDFSTKILYGSDWFMPMVESSNRLNHLLAHQTAIYDAGVMVGDPSELFKNYFHRNSLNFLNAKQRLRKTNIPSGLRSNINHLITL